jgi:hypothetical protein
MPAGKRGFVDLAIVDRIKGDTIAKRGEPITGGRIGLSQISTPFSSRQRIS